MANHASAIKRAKQNERRKARNSSVISEVKSAAKKVSESLKTAAADEIKTNLQKAIVLLDKAVSKGVLHRRNASRRISRLMHAVNAKLSGKAA